MLFSRLEKQTSKSVADTTFNIAKNLKYDGYQRELALMVHKFFDEKTSGGASMLSWSAALAT